MAKQQVTFEQMSDARQKIFKACLQSFVEEDFHSSTETAEDQVNAIRIEQVHITGVSNHRVN